jgi:hypothetical protein
VNVQYRYSNMNKTLMERQQRFAKLIDAVDCKAFGVEFIAILGLDGDRFWLQLAYLIDREPFKGRKWMLSPHMLDDEIVKTVWLAFEAAVKHELLEGFRFSGERVFNPHTPFTKFIEASRTEVFRPEPEGS